MPKETIGITRDVKEIVPFTPIAHQPGMAGLSPARDIFRGSMLNNFHDALVAKEHLTRGAFLV